MRGAAGFGVFSTEGEAPRVGFRVADGVLDLGASTGDDLFAASSLNRFLAAGREVWEATVERVGELVAGGAEVVPLDDVSVHLPFEVADYVDFYSSLEHATNLGRLFRPDADPLLPNWRHLPVGYHGRAGTIVVSGHARHASVRPGEGAGRGRAALRAEQAARLRARAGPRRRSGERARRAGLRERLPRPRLRRRPRQRLERARHPGMGVPAARPLPREVVRDLDLGLGHAARAARGQLRPRPRAGAGAAAVPPRHGDWALDLELEVELSGTVVSRTNARGLYWTGPQQLAHATVNGASLADRRSARLGHDLRPRRGLAGLAHRADVERRAAGRARRRATRGFLEDGDEVVLRGRAGDVELGEVRGVVQPARC